MSLTMRFEGIEDCEEREEAIENVVGRRMDDSYHTVAEVHDDKLKPRRKTGFRKRESAHSRNLSSRPHGSEKSQIGLGWKMLAGY